MRRTVSLSSLYDEVDLVMQLAQGQRAGFSISDDVSNQNRIVAVQPDSPAEAAGLKPFDLVLAIDGIECTPIKSAVSIFIKGAGKPTRRVRVRRAMNPNKPKNQSTQDAAAAAAERGADDDGAGVLPRVKQPRGSSSRGGGAGGGLSRSASTISLPPVTPTTPIRRSSRARAPTSPPSPAGRLTGKELILATMRLPESQLRNAAARGDDVAIRALIEEHEELSQEERSRDAGGDSSAMTPGRREVDGSGAGTGGLDVEAADSHGFTPLMLASFNGHTSTAALLLSLGACLDTTNVIGKTAVDLARTQGQQKVVWLLEAAARAARREAARYEKLKRKPQSIGAGDPEQEEEALRQMMGASWARSPGLRVARIFHRPGSPPPRLASSRARPSSPRARLRKDGRLVLDSPWQPSHGHPWWWADERTVPKTKRGPLTQDEMVGLHSRGAIGDETLVWQQPMEAWQPFSEALGEAKRKWDRRLEEEAERQRKEEEERRQREAERQRRAEEQRRADEERARVEEEERLRREEEERIAEAAAAVEREQKAIEDAFKKGNIPKLVELLKEGTEEQKEQAATALRNLASMASREHLANRVAIADAGGIEPLVALAKEGTHKQKEWAVRALRNLAGNDRNKKLIGQAGFFLGSW